MGLLLFLGAAALRFAYDMIRLNCCFGSNYNGEQSRIFLYNFVDFVLFILICEFFYIILQAKTIHIAQWDEYWQSIMDENARV